MIDSYVPRVGHRVKHKYEGDLIFTITEVYEHMVNAQPFGPLNIGYLTYVPRHVADATHHAFHCSRPDDVYFNPDDVAYNSFYAKYRPKHRAVD
jgi:hypothetical protein